MTTDKEIMKKLNAYFSVDGNVTIENGFVNCSGSVTYIKVTYKKDEARQLPVQFKSVGGDFYCSDNQLTSLAGAPQTVGGEFNCSNNRLESLAGAPQTVGGGFYCNNNRLTSLAGAPQSVRNRFYCHDNKLTSLRGAPQTVSDAFLCQRNKLTSLDGAPKSVGGSFFCQNNPITSLTKVPKFVGFDLKVPYGQFLPLLPLLNVKGCRHIVLVNDTGVSANKALIDIVNRYSGTGTQGMLSCAMEMIKEGYGSNARL